MTLERILSAAISSMIHGHHNPHYYSAWVKGKGYVGKGGTITDGAVVIHDRADYLRQLERDAQSEVDNLGYAQAYAEPGYTTPTNGIVFADWNKFPRDFYKVLERAGYAVEWSDEWATCDCGKAFRTSGDSYYWTPAYREVEGEILCLKCAKDAEPAENEEETDQPDPRD